MNINLPRVDEEVAIRLARHKLFRGDILFARRGAQATGSSAIVEDEHVGALCGTGAILLRILDKKRVDPTYMSFALSAPVAVQWLKDHAVGAVMPNLNADLIRRLEFRLPELARQEAIADILGAYDNKLELNRRTNETLESIARALFKSWFVDFDPVRARAEGRQPIGMDAETASLFPRDFVESELGPIPKGWKIAALGDAANLTMGQSPPGSTYNESGVGMPFYQGSTDFGFRFPVRRVFCSAPTRTARAGDSLISVRAPVGDLNMASEDCALGRGVASVRHKSTSRSFTYYLLASMSSAFARFDGEGTVFGSINKSSFTNLPCIEPPLTVIEAFDRVSLPLDALVETNQVGADTLAALRDAMLPRLLSGELSVSGAESAVAANL